MKKKEKNKLFEYLPACAAEFIKLVIKKMRYRKKVREDVQAELAAHFEDELRSYKTDNEKIQKAERLIENFGDAKLLGVLLRRAKKRCRPLWRTVVARTFQTVGVSILCLTAYLAWFFSGRPVVTVDYVAELNQIVRPAVDESLNAAPLYTKAAGLYVKEPNEIHKFIAEEYKELSPEQKQLINNWISENEQALQLVVDASKKPYCWREYKTHRDTTEMMAVLIPDLVEFKGLALALSWRAQLKVEQGWYNDAFSDIKSCYRFGQHLRGDKTLIEQLVGMSIETWATRTIRDILSEHKIDSAKLAKLQRDFEQMVADENFTVSLRFEKLTIYDEIQRCFTEDRLGGGHLYLRRIANWLIIEELASNNILHLANKNTLHILFTHPNKQETRETIDRYYGFWDKMVHKSPAQIRTEGIDTEKEAIQIIEGNLLLEFLVPAIGRIIELSHRIGVDVEATLAIIAILRYKQDTGDYPENLEGLVAAGYLKKIPLDPFSDKPLVYKKTDDNFLLYSVGLNFKDDDGQVYRDKEGKSPRLWYDKFGDTVFWPVPK